MKKYLMIPVLTIFILGNSILHSFATSVEPIPTKNLSGIEFSQLKLKKDKVYIIKYTITKTIGDCTITVTGYVFVQVNSEGTTTSTFPTPRATVNCSGDRGIDCDAEIVGRMDGLNFTEVDFKAGYEVANDYLNTKEFQIEFLNDINSLLQKEIAAGK